MNWKKDFGGSGSGLMQLSGIFLEGLRNIMKTSMRKSDVWPTFEQNTSRIRVS
jgi:hypothetical protein